MKVFRWKAVGTLAGGVVLVAACSWLFLDTLVRRTIIAAGEMVVGAKVELESAHVQLGAGRLLLRGLRVTNPSHPMQNLVEISQLTAMLRPLPLLEKKVIIDSLVAREVRFATPRRTSGALHRSGGAASAVMDRVTAWASQIRLPSFSLEGLGKAIDLPPLSPDSLRTVQQARSVVQFTDSARREWDAAARALDPGPKIDSAKALAARLRTLDARTLGVDAVRQTVQTTKATLDALSGTLDRVRKLERSVDSGVTRVRAGVAGLDDARRGDYAFARGLLKLPSLEGPDISPALFGKTALERLQTVLYWARLAEQYMPAGLKPRERDGPKRLRMAGTTVLFPRARGRPAFLVRYAALDLAIGGTGAAAGDYVARLSGLTTEPTIYGQPFVFLAQRSAGRAGPETVRVAGVVDHVRTPSRDSLEAAVGGVALPSLPLPPVNARAQLGTGTTELSLFRRGDEILARWLMRSTNVRWERLADSAGGAGAAREVASLVWRTVSGVHDVEVAGTLRGALTGPAFSVSSNLGTELARRLRQEIGAKVAEAERRVRAQVDTLVAQQTAAARQRLTAVQSDVQSRLAKQEAELVAVRSDLEARLKGLTGKLSLPKLPISLPRKP